MCVKYFRWATRQIVGSPISKLLLLLLADFADDRGLCWPRVRRLAELSELSERAIRAHLKDLQRQGLIGIERRTVNGRNTSNHYRLLAKSTDANAATKAFGAPALQEPGARPAAEWVQDEQAIVNHQSEPSLKPSVPFQGDPISAPNRSEEKPRSLSERWYTIWREFRLLPGFSPTMSEAKARKNWIALGHDRPPDDQLIEFVREHRQRLISQNSNRSAKMGPIWIAHPHTWLSERSWEQQCQPERAEPEIISQAIFKLRSSLGDAVVRVLKEQVGLTDQQLVARFSNATFEPGPPQKFVFSSTFMRDLVSTQYGMALETKWPNVTLVTKL